MKEVDKNRLAWNLLAKDHYEYYKKRLIHEDTILNPIIINELGDISGKKLIHLQCNGGADTICLSRLGAKITGVDFAPDNIHYARILAKDFGVLDATFIEANLMEFKDCHHKKYDVVFTSEGVLGWLPDLNRWAQTVASLLNPDGFFYINEIHPFFLMLDEEAYAKKEFKFKYPYFGNQLDKSETIGGYATTPQKAECYYWMFSLSEIVNSLINAGLEILYIHESDTLCYQIGDMPHVNYAQLQWPEWKGKIPMMFSIKARLRNTL
ncbi:MAG: class I SAM-dependent methyltransferase [Candidatus Izemoplasmatales bacterium]|nr:class I SAM-dependent methyltransferase [Candidatus Izemoplasmatales bacterium]